MAEIPITRFLKANSEKKAYVFFNWIKRNNERLHNFLEGKVISKPDDNHLTVSIAGLGSSLTFPVEYLTCNAKAFQIGDKCTIYFPHCDYSNGTIIGFAKQSPRPCSVFVEYSGGSVQLTKVEGNAYRVGHYESIAEAKEEAVDDLQSDLWYAGGIYVHGIGKYAQLVAYPIPPYGEVDYEYSCILQNSGLFFSFSLNQYTEWTIIGATLSFDLYGSNGAFSVPLECYKQPGPNVQEEGISIASFNTSTEITQSISVTDVSHGVNYFMIRPPERDGILVPNFGDLEFDEETSYGSAINTGAIYAQNIVLEVEYRA